jgi:L-alanine-DL-glutamate epimerase-like enolase superfamily enzyme
MKNNSLLSYQELEEHKIARINTKRVRYRYPRLYGKNSRLAEHSYGGDATIAEIITDKGAVGWGMKSDWSARTYGAYKNKEELQKMFVGRRISDIFHPQTGVLSDDALQLDFALHDLAGKILNIPVYEMFEEQAQVSIDCYDGAIYMNDISPDSRPGGLKAILDDCKQDYDMGYRSFKIKIGRGGMWMPFEDGLKRDIEVTRMIREFFPESKILVDANDAYTVDGFLRYMDAVYDCNLFWIEEPFAENREDLLKLKDYLAKKSPGTLIADGEFEPNVELIYKLAEEKLIDVMLMDIDGFGFTKWRNKINEINTKGYKVSPHCWGSKLKTHYTAQFAKGCKNAITIEGVPDLTEGIDFDDYRLVNGKMFVPDKPGFGMDLIWAHNA